MNRRSLRFRMMILFGAVVGLLLASSCLGFYLMFRRVMWDQLDRRLREAGAPIISDLITEPGVQDVNNLDIPGQYFEVLDAQGGITQQSRNLPSPLPLVIGANSVTELTFDTINVAGLGTMRVAVAPFSAGGERLFLVTGESTAEVGGALAIVRHSAAVLLGISLLLTAGVSWFYTDRSLRPVKDLIRNASEMEARLSHLPQDSRVAVRSMDGDELTLLASTFRRLFERVNTVLDQLRRFVTDASHELRTPLSILRGEAELLLSRSRTPAEYEYALRIIDSELNRLSRIVEGLFTLSMADAGALRIAPEPLYLEEVLQETCTSVASLTSSKNIRVEQDMQKDVSFYGDPAFLHQLFLIFVDNAIKYSPPGTRLRVTLRSKEQAEVRFEDQGIGIAKEHIPRIFERFFRVAGNGSGETQSGGLGLAIAQAIVQAHHGTIECDSQPGAGSTFTIRLPLQPPTAN
jgi:two-component system OmpR family sensor kinase